MNPAADRFIELATQPLADNAELQLIAEGELRQRLEQNAASPQAITEANDALARADQHPRRHWWRPALYLTTLLVSVPVLVHSVKRIRENLAPDHLPSSVGTPDPSDAALIPNITPSQKLLLLGDTAAANDADRWKALWNSNPNNPAYLAEYASAYFLEHRKLSPEILEAAASIDPDNGWYSALSAAGVAEGSVTRGYRSTEEIKADAPLSWKIDSAEKLDKTLELIHQAAQKPAFTAYQNDLLRDRIPLFAPRKDFVSQFPVIAYTATQRCPSIHFRKLADALAAGAQECAKQQDIEGFRQIVEDWTSLNQHLARNGDTLIDLLIAKVFCAIPLRNFRDAAQTLDLTKEAERFATLHADFKAEKEARRNRAAPDTTLANHHGSIFAYMTVPMVARQVTSPPTLTNEDLKPGRYTDHALFGRAASLAAWILLGIAAGLAALHRYRQSGLARHLSKRFLGLLRPIDWAWILIGGTLVPLIWFLIVTRLTPLSAREWSLIQLGLIQSIGQYAALAASTVVLPLVIAAWRLGKRGHALGLQTQHSWLGWAAVGAAMLAVPAFGGIMAAGPHGNMVLILACVLAGIPVLWLLVGFFLNILGKPAHALRRATLSRMALPAWIFGMLVMVATIHFHYAEERHWVQLDHLSEVIVEKPGPSRYEWEVTQALRKELLEMMK